MHSSTGDTVIKEEEWKSRLTYEQYDVLRRKGTERPFSGKLLHNKGTGTYNCAACGNVLFSSKDKFDSGSGWPSFKEVMVNGNVLLETDRSHGMVRTEVMCARCKGHLGHVFDDGPGPAGLRYCINSVSLDFKPESQK
ncbi:MAG: peptide-methionine (R)-S-oxide reductase MsrB [Candidatus Thermoplasmatota archaeon]|nr:peptide-methionine (R)-S-oxide reductase MsrB [Candidatus Thermoplasmatota archaeon]